MGFVPLFQKLTLALMCSHLANAVELESTLPSTLKNLHGQQKFAKVHGETIWDVSKGEMEELDAASMVQLNSEKFTNFHEGMANVILTGRGVEVQRAKRVQARWVNRIGRKKPEEKSEFFLKQLGWFKRPVEGDIPIVLGPEHLKNPDLIKFTHESYVGDKVQLGGMDGVTPLKLYPIDVRGAEHVKLWTRIPLTHRLALAPRKGEVKPKFDANDEEILQFLQNFDMFGTNKSLEEYPTVELGSGLIPPPGHLDSWEGMTKGEKADYMAAMRWVGRHITETIQEAFPEKEFGWFVVNKHFRSFHAPAEVHIIFPKEEAEGTGAQKLLIPQTIPSKA